MEKITILVNPVGKTFEEKTADIYHFIKYSINCKPSFQEEKIFGPNAVLRSLINGLEKNKINFNVNPKKTKEIGDIVVVLSNHDALKQAIILRKKGKIKKLLAGPNLVVLPSEAKHLICSEYIDTYLVNSEWTRKAYIEDAPELTNKIAIWPAGVDTSYWKPGRIRKNQVLVYIKSGPEELIEKLIRLLKNNKFTLKIIRYKDYNKNQYLKLLKESAFVVFFSKSESQGLSVFESWACNVPTLVWNRGFAIPYPNAIREKRIPASSAPYLSEQTGLFFKDGSELNKVLVEFIKRLRENTFKPRQYILNSFTDKQSAKKLLDIIFKKNES